MHNLTENVIQFAKKRGISKETLHSMQVGSGIAQFGNRKLESIVFNYYRDGKRVNYKARAIEEKIFTQEVGGEQRFYNLSNVLQSNTLETNTIWIVEGEMDALSLLQAGVGLGNILSVPGGANATPIEHPEESRKYEYVLDALDQGLDKAMCFILLLDSDQAGLALRQDLVSILGYGKCKYFDFPEGIKDANEALIAWGEDTRWTIEEGLQNFPIEGVYNLDEIPEPPDIQLYNPSILGWEDKFLLAKGTVSCFTGFPGAGKTSFAIQLWTHIARDYNCTVGMFSGETRVKPYVVRNIRTFYHKKLEWEMTDAEKEEADTFIRKHFIFLNHPNNTPSFNFICERIRDMKARYGISAFLLDPWNKLETPEFFKMSETAWIGKCLDYLTSLAKMLDIHIMILAHPAKPDMKYANAPPTAYSIAGSAHWNNKPDHIFSLWREKFENEDDGSRCTEAIFTVCKTRYEELGYPRVLKIQLNLENGCFEGEKKEVPAWQNRKDLS